MISACICISEHTVNRIGVAEHDDRASTCALSQTRIVRGTGRVNGARKMQTQKRLKTRSRLARSKIFLIELYL